jgi:hypothetical protein
MSKLAVPSCGSDSHESGDAAGFGAADLLNLAAAPTFATMALLSAVVVGRESAGERPRRLQPTLALMNPFASAAVRNLSYIRSRQQFVSCVPEQRQS